MTTRVHFLSLMWLLCVPQLQGFRPAVHTHAAALVGSRHRTTPVSATARTWQRPPRRYPSTQRQASLSSNNNEAAVPVGSPPTTRAFVWYLPPSLSVMAYCLYDDTSSAFHKLLDWASGNTWVPADGGKYISEITRNALTGPVTFSVSILFGSLVGLTISTLHGRQMSLQRLFVTLHEDGKEMEALLKAFPANDPAIALLTHFMMRIDTSLQVPTKSTEAALRQNTELAQLTAWLHGIDESTVKGTILAETYATLTRLKATRIELWAAYIRCVSPMAVCSFARPSYLGH